MTLSKSSSKKRKYRKSRTIEIATAKLEHSSNMLPIIGYFLLGLIFLDYVFLLIPPHFLNPTWEIQVIGHFVENVWAPLLGFSLVFIRKNNNFKSLELRLLSWLSRLILLMAIMYFLFAPLLISNTIKIQNKSFSQLKTKLEMQRTQVAQFKTKLGQIPEEQLANYLKQSQSQSSSATTGGASGTLWEQTVSKVEEEHTKSTEQIKKTYKKQKIALFKRNLKWCIGTLLSGAIFLLFWRHTEWARKTSSN